MIRHNILHMLDAEQLGEVHENVLDFVGLALFDECTKDDDVFALSRTRCIVS